MGPSAAFGDPAGLRPESRVALGGCISVNGMVRYFPFFRPTGRFKRHHITGSSPQHVTLLVVPTLSAVVVLAIASVLGSPNIEFCFV
jgi:hypothetical protein